jgi:shikimate dehydrogenase
MTEKNYGIIGRSLSHSLSPFLHNYWFTKYGVKAKYSLIEIEPNEIGSTIQRIKKRELQGINVTVPYKQTVIPYLDLIINEAKSTESVNTISLNEEGKVIGDNTDVYGLEQSFVNKLETQNLKQKKILVLGAGGVTFSVVYALKNKGANQIIVSNRTLEKAENVKRMFPFIELLDWKNIEDGLEKIDIIINATSLGLKGGEDFKQEFKNTKSNLIYYDVIYNPIETKLIKKFKKKGIQTFNGLEMFIYQAQKSFFLWNKIMPELDEKLKESMVLKLR